MAIHGNKSQGAHQGAGRLQVGQSSPAWSPPTSRRAASTSTSCPRRQLELPNVPGGLCPPHRPDRPRRRAQGEAVSLVCVDETASCATSKSSSSARSRGSWWLASSPIPTRSPSPSCWAAPCSIPTAAGAATPTAGRRERAWWPGAAMAVAVVARTMGGSRDGGRPSASPGPRRPMAAPSPPQATPAMAARARPPCRKGRPVVTAAPAPQQRSAPDPAQTLNTGAGDTACSSRGQAVLLRGRPALAAPADLMPRMASPDRRHPPVHRARADARRGPALDWAETGSRRAVVARRCAWAT